MICLPVVPRLVTLIPLETVQRVPKEIGLAFIYTGTLYNAPAGQEDGSLLLPGCSVDADLTQPALEMICFTLGSCLFFFCVS